MGSLNQRTTLYDVVDAEEHTVIPYGRQYIDDEDIAAVVDVLKSDFLTQGPAVANFENSVRKLCHSKYAVAANSATSALHIACIALDIGPDDLVWTSPISFVASANCALYCGAKVDFVDIDPKTYNMCANALEEKLAKAKLNNKLPKLVIPVHLCGQACDMKRIHELSQIYGFKIVEDASHAIGGLYRGRAIGDCSYSDITVFSFHPVKIITTAEGGMAVTNNTDLAYKLTQLRSHGITRDESLMTEDCHGPWYYQQLHLGFNYRMTDLQATLGCSQIKKIEKFIKRREEIATRYDRSFKNLPLLVPWQNPETRSARHLYVIRLKLKEIALSHRQVFESLRALGIGVNLHYIPIHMQPYYQAMGFEIGDYPHAEAYYKDAISIPMFPAMSDRQQMKVIDSLEEVLSA